MPAIYQKSLIWLLVIFSISPSITTWQLIVLALGVSA
jgi:hypothetical protein